MYLAFITFTKPDSKNSDRLPDSFPSKFDQQLKHFNYASPRRDFTTRIPINNFVGHRNKRTICKQAIFYGKNDEWIISGSECGHFYVWKNEVGNSHQNSPIAAYLADSRVVNSLDSDGYLLASSGIERTVKLWRPNFGGSGEVDFLVDKLSQEQLSHQLEVNRKFNEDAEDSINVPIQLMMMLNRLRNR